ncbi:MAG: replication protein [Candidatus Binatia bacterium]
MAKPQIENGFLKVATELAKAIMEFPFTSREYACVWCVLVHTYGFNRSTAVLSQRYIAGQTKMSPRHAWETMADLVKMKVIRRWDNSGRFSWKLQKNYELWQRLKTGERKRNVAPKEGRPHNGATSDQNGATICQNGATDPDPTMGPENAATPSEHSDKPNSESGPQMGPVYNSLDNSLYKEHPKRQSGATTESIVPAAARPVPRHFHQLPTEIKDRLDVVINDRGWKTAPNFNAHAWIGRTLRTRPGYDPEALEWILERVNPNGKAKSLWKVCNDLLTQAENRVRDDRKKAEAALSPRGGMRSIAEILGGSK